MQKSKPSSHCKIRRTIGTSAILGFVSLGCASHREGSDQKELNPGFNQCAATATDPSACVNLGIKDPGSRPMTQQMCDDAEAGLEFLPLPIWDMGPVTDSTGATRFMAVGWYSYDDNTTPFRVPGKVYEPTTDPVTRCGDNNPNDYYALHLYGGPFQEWGGGFGRMLKCMNTDSTDSTHHPWLNALNINKYLCAARSTTAFRVPNESSLAACHWALKKPADPACTDGTCRTPLEQTMVGVCPQRDLNYAKDGKPDLTDEPYMTGMALDVSDHVMHDPGDPTDNNGNGTTVRGWEGIAFWARRSPNSQPEIRVAVADKYIDDDMSYLSEKYDPNRPRNCERAATCNCNNSKPCTPTTVDYYVFDVDGNRVKYAQDPHPANPRDACAKKPALDADGRSMINLSGEVVTDAQGNQKKWPDGSTVTPYNGCPGTDGSAQGQPWQTDVRAPQVYGFCFDPAVDPIPPASTLDNPTPLELVNHRVYQDPKTAFATVNNYQMCGQNTFTSSYPADSWIRFFCDPQEVPGYNYTVCGNNACNLEYPSFQAPDPWYHGKQCLSFSFIGSITRGYCYDPNSNRNPPEGTQACGDFWQKPVNIGVDWTFIRVPFTSLLQQGWAKRQYQLDLSSITAIRFEWDRGWMDYQISDVRFYRTKQ